MKAGAATGLAGREAGRHARRQGRVPGPPGQRALRSLLACSAASAAPRSAGTACSRPSRCVPAQEGTAMLTLSVGMRSVTATRQSRLSITKAAQSWWRTAAQGSLEAAQFCGTAPSCIFWSATHL